MDNPLFFHGLRIFVTGGHGFVGRHLLRALQKLGAQVTAPSRSECDLLVPNAVQAQIASASPDLVIHLAAHYGGLGYTLENPAKIYFENTIASTHLLEACAKVGVGKVLTIGTPCSYPTHLQSAMREDQLWTGPLHPSVQFYGMAKKMTALASAAYRAQYGLHAIHVIPSQLYGPGDHLEDHKSHVVSALLKRFLLATQHGLSVVPLWGRGRAVRDFLYVEDFVTGLLKLAAHYEEPGVINLSTGRGTSIATLAKEMIRVTGFRGKLLWDGNRPEGQPSRVLDNTKLKEALVWTPPTSLRDGLAKTYAWLCETLSPLPPPNRSPSLSLETN